MHHVHSYCLLEASCLLQAWFREGSAAKELELYEDAAQAFFEAYRLDSSNPELAQAFQESIKLGQDQYKRKQQSNKS